MSVSRDLSEADIVFNRASLALAKSQRLIASWLPPKTPNGVATSKSEEELDREESEIFSPVPELLGLGAPVPQDGDRHRSHSRHQSSYPEDKLRKKILGERVSKNLHEDGVGTCPRSNGPVSTKHRLHELKGGSESEDEVGRTAFRKTTRPMNSRSDTGELPSDPAQAASDVSSLKVRQITSHTAPLRKRPSSYLDEVLLARSERRKKKKRGPGTVKANQ